MSLGQAPGLVQRQEQRVAGAQTYGHVVARQTQAGQGRGIVAGERNDPAVRTESEPLHVIVTDRTQVGARRYGRPQPGRQAWRARLKK